MMLYSKYPLFIELLALYIFIHLYLKVMGSVVIS